ncbi:MAG: triacylglycerol lipase [Clostridiales bacterium]|nr:triacylglycerol lipase [Clostridiales bacterium]
MTLKKLLQRIANCILLLLCCNSFILFNIFDSPVVVKVCAIVVLLVFYVGFNIYPYGRGKRSDRLRLRVLIGGRECILTAMACLLVEIAGFAVVFALVYKSYYGFEIILPVYLVLSINAVVFLILLGIVVINGFVRIFAASRQADISTKLLLFFFWWMPVLNAIWLKKLCSSAINEYTFASKKMDTNESRRHQEVCKTKYPLLLVHGIFFRDWKNFNYWGRIPKELEANGAACYYGNQESSAPVEECGAQLAECIKGIVSETGCEKLNIIAHSKGGLDSRYAISCLGAAEYVASLTTVCTPHYGCNSVRKILKAVPGKALQYIKKNYETLFTVLGDDSPDFMGGLANLTDTECAALNQRMPNDPGVYYQSVGSKMGSHKSAVFPLSLGYRMIKSSEGDNDGLVAVVSMEWGNFLGIVAPPGKQGISHGDMIDLTRKDIKGFDVCEFYVDLVSQLKDRGL